MLKSFCVIALVALTACSHSLLDREQRSARSRDFKTLKKELPQIYSAIDQAGTAGALVIIDRASIASVTPANRPTAAFLAPNKPTTAPGAHCYFVYERAAALAPNAASCHSVRDEAEEQEKARRELLAATEKMSSDVAAIHAALARHREQQDLRMARFSKSITRFEREIRQFSQEVRQFDRALTTSFKLGVINADTLGAHERSLGKFSQFVAENREELAGLSETVATLVKDFEANTKAIQEAINTLPK